MQAKTPTTFLSMFFLWLVSPPQLFTCITAEQMVSSDWHTIKTDQPWVPGVIRLVLTATLQQCKQRLKIHFPVVETLQENMVELGTIQSDKTNKMTTKRLSAGEMNASSCYFLHTKSDHCHVVTFYCLAWTQFKTHFYHKHNTLATTVVCVHSLGKNSSL